MEEYKRQQRSVRQLHAAPTKARAVDQMPKKAKRTRTSLLHSIIVEPIPYHELSTTPPSIDDLASKLDAQSIDFLVNVFK